MKKKIMSIFMVIAITIFQFAPTMVSATTTITQDNKIVNTTTSETLTFDEREHNSTIYAGEIKKDGITVLNYLYSDDVTRSSVLFDNVRKALSNPYSDMVPSIIEEQTTDGLHEISTQTLNGVDLTTITSGWTNASNIATQIYNGTNTDIVNSNMYDVDNEFKTEVDENETDRASIDNPIENNKSIISHLGTQTHDEVSFSVVEGNLIEVHNVDLTYLSEATTVIYTSVNVTTETTPATTKINTLNIGIASPKVGDTATATTKPTVTLDSNPNYEIDHIAYVTAYPSEKPMGEYDMPFTGTFEDGKEYYVEVSLHAKDGYVFRDNNNMTLKVNGKTTGFEKSEWNADGSTYYMFFAKVQATAEKPTYEYIDDTANQTYKINQDETLTFRINADYSLFENGGVVYVDGTETTEYTSKSGSTIITLNKDFVNSLSVGEHTLKVAFNNGGEATTKFTIAKAEESTNNPQTGDNIMFYISMLGLSIIGLAGAGLYIRKRRFD